MEKKGAEIVWQKLVPWIIAIAFVVIAFIMVVILRGEGSNLFERIKDFFRFR